MSEKRTLRFAIIGAGASGIMASVKLRTAGHDDITIFEKGPDVGGTWRTNTYPGIACDVPSHLYRFSFAPNPNWSRVCSPGPEILAYMKATAATHGVHALTEFDCEIIGATYDDGQWRLDTTRGPRGPFDVLITAAGVLRYPAWPDIAGLDQFAGNTIHSADWDHRVSPAGKRVGVIGTGSSAIQIVSAIVDEAESLSLFQRTAQWILPQPNPEIDDESRQRYQADTDALEAEYQRLSVAFHGRYAAAVVGDNPAAYNFMERQCRDHLENSVTDPDLRERLRPGYKVGCKRLIMSDTFYTDIQKPNASLVSDSIVAIEPRGVRTSDGALHELDVLVLATGYDAHSFLDPMRIAGRDGLVLDDAWARSKQAYLGVAVPEFPNLFMIGGPNSPIGNFSFLMTAELQFGYALSLISRLADGAREVSPTQVATRRFNDELREKMKQTIWVSGCSSWYMDANGDIASWPWNYERFVSDMTTVNWDDLDVRRVEHGEVVA